MRRVVITGGGVISALGTEWPEILARLRTFKNCVRRMDEWDIYKGMNTKIAAPVERALPEYPRKKTRGMGRVAHLAMAATEQALKQAGLEDSPELRNGRTGIAYGSCMGSMAPLLDFYEMIVNRDATKMNATTYVKAMPYTAAANIEVYYGLTGRLITTNTACSSGSMSIGMAYETILAGKQDIMIAGGAEELSAADAAIFDTLFAASTKNDAPEKTPAAYDRGRDGLVIGEGGGALILEEYEHARKRGAAIYAEIAGFGTNTDGTHITNPNRDTMAAAVGLALEDAKISPEKIGYVNTHGTATTAGDVAESGATWDVFKRAVPVSTIKNYVGHTLGACGAIEAWVTIMMMRENWFHPNINLVDLDPDVAPLDYIIGEGREIHADYVMSNNFAFGGVNTSLVFKRFS